MPVRKIPKNHCSVTGLIANGAKGTMTAFESTLERDFMLLVDFDHQVLSYEEQPVRIDYTTADGKAHHYTPDILVTYRKDVAPAKDLLPLLAEIKYRRDLFKRWKELKPKFRAARRYAKEEGWIFKIITEVEIRTPYLDNVKFLRQYRRLQTDGAQANLLLECISELREADPETLLLTVFSDPIHRAQLLPTHWQLVAQNLIAIDLTQPLTMRSRIWSAIPRSERGGDEQAG